MSPVVHHVVLGLAIAALGGAGLRLASLAAPSGPERAVAAVVIAASIAALEALALGLVRLGTSTAALAGAAALTWLLARSFLPAPDSPPGTELAAAWRRPPPARRVALGAVAGVWLAWAVWLLRYPALGIDTVGLSPDRRRRLGGRRQPGRDRAAVPQRAGRQLPAHERGAAGLGHGDRAELRVRRPVGPGDDGAAGRGGLGGAARRARSGGRRHPAVAALCVLPVLTHYQQNGANTDIPAFAWLVSAAFLSLASARRPALIAPALLAAALAVGTKTTTLPLAAAGAGSRAGGSATRAAPAGVAAGAGGRRGGRGRRLLVPAQPGRPRLALLAVRRDALERPATEGDRAEARRERQLPRPSALHARARRRRVARSIRRRLLAAGRGDRGAVARARQAGDRRGRRNGRLGADLDERAVHRRLGARVRGRHRLDRPLPDSRRSARPC